MPSYARLATIALSMIAVWFSVAAPADSKCQEEFDDISLRAVYMGSGVNNRGEITWAIALQIKGHAVQRRKVRRVYTPRYLQEQSGTAVSVERGRQEQTFDPLALRRGPFDKTLVLTLTPPAGRDHQAGLLLTIRVELFTEDEQNLLIGSATMLAETRVWTRELKDPGRIPREILDVGKAAFGRDSVPNPMRIDVEVKPLQVTRQLAQARGPEGFNVPMASTITLGEGMQVESVLTYYVAKVQFRSSDKREAREVVVRHASTTERGIDDELLRRAFSVVVLALAHPIDRAITNMDGGGSGFHEDGMVYRDFDLEGPHTIELP
jgi:hypothetical protein